MDLAPCSACRRHVRRDDVRCPFCGSDAARPARMVTSPAARASRAMLFAATVGVSAAVSACPESKTPVAPPTSDDAGAAAQETAPLEPIPPPGNPLPGHTAPPPPAGPPPAPKPHPPVALYGAPPPPPGSLP